MVSYTNQKIGAPFPVVLNVCGSDSLTSVCLEDVPPKLLSQLPARTCL